MRNIRYSVLPAIKKFNKMYKELDLENKGHISSVSQYGKLILRINPTFIDIQARVEKLDAMIKG